jgi:hypothetical protein
MEPVYFVMALLGCADDGSDCRQARVEPARYTSAEACKAQIPAALWRNTDIDFPLIGAECQSSARRVPSEQRPARRPGG